jgi:hypothetical protein
MINSKGSAVVVGDQGPHDVLAGAVVVPDHGGEGEDVPDQRWSKRVASVVRRAE